MNSAQPSSKSVAIIGSGPAGLMAADVLSQNGIVVSLFEKKSSPAKKILIAGSSGLNVAYDDDFDNILKFYSGHKGRLKKNLKNFDVQAWRAFLENLGIKTFIGTSRRVFVKGLKAGPLVKGWVQKLKSQGVKLHYGKELTGLIVPAAGKVSLELNRQDQLEFDAVMLAMGGASWEPDETPLRWPGVLKKRGVNMVAFRASNAGFDVNWPKKFLAEAEGLPLKNIILKTPKGLHQGDVVVTRYGIEGTPVYHVGIEGKVHLDLKPDLTEKDILFKLKQSRENLAPLRAAKKYLGLNPAALALLFHLAPVKDVSDREKFAELVKNFPLELKTVRPLAEAISSAGGVDWESIDDHLMLKKLPGVFVAGEMIDWDAPTGGFLIHMCAAQGRFAAQSILRRLI